MQSLNGQFVEAKARNLVILSLQSICEYIPHPEGLEVLVDAHSCSAECEVQDEKVEQFDHVEKRKLETSSRHKAQHLLGYYVEELLNDSGNSNF